MRVNVYQEEVTGDVVGVRKEPSLGQHYAGARLILHSPTNLHYTPTDDDRSAVTMWVNPRDLGAARRVISSLRAAADVLESEVESV
jgi:hypothetical protein